MYTLSNTNLLENGTTGNLTDMQTLPLLQTDAQHQQVSTQITNSGTIFNTDAGLVQYIQNPTINQTFSNEQSTNLAPLSSLQMQPQTLSSLLDCPSSTNGINIPDLPVQIAESGGQQYLILPSYLVLNNVQQDVVQLPNANIQEQPMYTSMSMQVPAIQNNALEMQPQQQKDNEVSYNEIVNSTSPTVKKLQTLGQKPSTTVEQTEDGKQALCLSDIMPSLYKPSHETILHCDKCHYSTHNQTELKTHGDWHRLNENNTTRNVSKPKKDEKRKPAGKGKTSLVKKRKTAQMKRSEGKELRLYKCDICNSEQTSAAAHKKHMKQHVEEKLFKCDECSEAFNKEHNLRLHKALHIPISAECGRGQYQCPECSKSFSRKASFKMHLTLHAEEETFMCKECGDEFNTKNDLSIHIQEHSVDLQRVLTNKNKEDTNITDSAIAAENSIVNITTLHPSMNATGSAPIIVNQNNMATAQWAMQMNVQSAVPNNQVTLQELTSTTTITNAIGGSVQPNIINQEHNTISIHQTGNVVSLQANTVPVTMPTGSTTAVTSTTNNINEQATKLTNAWTNFKTNNTNRKSSSKSRVVHKCDSCEKIFTKKCQLSRHFRIHTGDKPFKCPVCEKAFNQKGSLTTHMNLHSEKKPFQCPHCPQTYAQRGNLRTHIYRVHTVAQPYFCTVCSCSFAKVGTLNSHIAKYHNGLMTKELEASEARTDENQTEESLNRVAMMVEVEDSPDTNVALEPEQINKNTNLKFMRKIKRTTLGNSTVCTDETGQLDLSNLSPNLIPPHGDKFSGDGQKYLHMWKVRKMNGRKYHQCMFCAKEFRKPSDLIRHIRVHTHEKPYKCPQCPRAFAIKTSLTSHIKSHLGIRPFKCNVCQKSFITACSLNVHMRLHAGSKPYACPHCDKKFRTYSHRTTHLKVHMKRQAKQASMNINGSHNTVQHINGMKSSAIPRSLTFEPLVMDKDGTLKPHIKKVPGTLSGEDPTRVFKCKVCKKAFKKPCHLKPHMRSHTGERPYTCQQCNKSFLSSGVLRAHMKTHLGILPYQCNICPSSFLSIHALKRHALAHSDSRPYFCPYCKKSFKSIAHCKKHILTHDSQIEITSQQQTSGGSLTSLHDNNSDIPNHPTYSDGLVSDVPASTASLETYMQHSSDETADNMQQVDPNMVIQDRTHPLPQATESLPSNESQSSDHFDLGDFADLSLPENDLFQQNNSQDNNNMNNSMDFMVEIPESEITDSLNEANIGLLHSFTESSSQGFAESSTHSFPEATSAEVLETELNQQEVIQDKQTTYWMNQTIPPPENNKEEDASKQEAEKNKSKDVVFLCPHCNVQMTNLTHLYSHINTHCSNDKSKTCPKCSISFDCDSVLEAHMDTQHKNSDRPPIQKRKKKSAHYQISEDQVEILTQMNQVDNLTLSERVLLKELDQKNRVCVEVKKGRGRKKALETNGPIHSNVCPHCPKSFAKKTDLVRHIRIHTGEKPWKCSECDKKFRVRSSLVTHQRTHIGISSFKCHICNLMYASTSSLKIHMRIHTGGQPFKCPHCSMRFRTSGFRKSHIKAHHENKVDDQPVKSGRKKGSTAHSSKNIPITAAEQSNGLSDITLSMTESTQGMAQMPSGNVQLQIQNQNIQLNQDPYVTLQLDNMYPASNTSTQSTTSVTEAPPNLVIQPLSSLGLTQQGRNLKTNEKQTQQHEINIAVPSNIANITQQIFQQPSSTTADTNNNIETDVQFNGNGMLQQLQQLLGGNGGSQTTEHTNVHKTTNESFNPQELYNNSMQPYTLMLSGPDLSSTSDNSTNHQYTLALTTDP